ncbi:hypothetical protein TWF696_002519 [Orbilia brochopaga]|uniref:Diphthine--ammonia ligase n=1 Tax=Orbilia brochopaga TaxID=3140254 RepID=A0AAV9U1H5_9PEZI
MPTTLATENDAIPTVALVSGGKDSFFSLIHSNANGFKVVALANLYPALSASTLEQTASDDLNSFMYQTVGHNVLQHYSRILDIPLYRAPIKGASINQELSYYPEATTDQKDETEDLYDLLLSIRQQHPEIKAVCSGAILSSYQRTRVENVCQRLGLISVAWLWQRRQESVLTEMAEVGLDAIIIKVASLGLDERWLGRSITDASTRLALDNIKKRWGGNVAGEGGEFETLVLGCYGWAKRLQIEKSETMKDEGGVAWTRFLESRVIDASNAGGESRRPPKPHILESGFQKILERSRRSTLMPKPQVSCLGFPPPPYRFETAIHVSSRHVYIANLHGNVGDAGAEDQIHSIFLRLREILRENALDERRMTSTFLLLRDMADFQLVNKAYARFCTFPNPASRVCVAIGVAMPADTHVLLSVMVAKSCGMSLRKGLHVQSRSYWAPANIGPYSQAISVDGIVTVSGTIGLLPETMRIWEDEGVEGETALALQSMVRVGREMNVHGKQGWLGGVGFVVDDRDAAVMQATWQGWFNGSASEELTGEDSEAGFFEKSDLDIRPPAREEHSLGPPLLIVQVDKLPVQAHVEFACLGLDPVSVNGPTVGNDPDGVGQNNGLDMLWKLGRLFYEAPDGNLMYHAVEFAAHRFLWGVLEGDVEEIVARMASLQKAGFETVSLALYLGPGIWEHAAALVRRIETLGAGAGYVPVSRVLWLHGEKMANYGVGFAIQAVCSN